jgi:hypothetical protein
MWWARPDPVLSRKPGYPRAVFLLACSIVAVAVGIIRFNAMYASERYFPIAAGILMSVVAIRDLELAYRQRKQTLKGG